MNLDDFEDYIDPYITLMRGADYYSEGSVLSLEETSPNTYSAKVAGSKVYEVIVHLDDDREVEDISCTCPYDWGEHCKHEVAVLYALRHQLTEEDDREIDTGNGSYKGNTNAKNEPPNGLEEKPKDEHEYEEGDTDENPKKVERSGSVDLVSLLEGVSKEALVAFLAEYAQKSPSLMSGLVLAFPSSDEQTNLKNLGIEFRLACMHGAEVTYFGRDYEWEAENEENYVWHFTSTFKKKIEELLEMIRAAIMEERIRYAGSIASMMVHELASFDCDTDHIAEDVEAAVSQIASLFDEVVPSLEDARWLFSQFFAEADYYDSKAQATLLRLCIRFADSSVDQDVLENYLVELAADETEGLWGFNVTIQNSVELRHSLLLKQQRVREAHSFALGHLHYDSMRRLAFDQAMEDGEYDLAERLVKEKESVGRYLYGSAEWEDLLFSVYKVSGNREKMRILSRRFLLRDNLAYYPILKGCYDEREWETVVEGLLDELEANDAANKAWRRGTYPKVLKAEKRYQRLLSYVQKVPALVNSYQDVLLPHYRDEVYLLYKQVILARGETAANRNEYRALASWLEELVSLGGIAVAKECLSALEPRYKKRPAMRDELRKVGVL